MALSNVLKHPDLTHAKTGSDGRFGAEVGVTETMMRLLERRSDANS